MDRVQAGWLVMTALSGLWAAAGLIEGGTLPIVSGLLFAVAASCAVHAGSRRQVMTAAGRAFSGSTLRTVVIVFAAASLIQFLPLELALFAAGDVLAYVELMAAVGLITANARFLALRQSAGARFSQAVERVRQARRHSRARRAARPARPRPPRADDPEPRAWAFA